MIKIDKQHIEDRVNDWVKRLDSLYTFVEKALVHLDGVRCQRNRNITMYEDLMQKNDVSPQQLPILDIYKNENIVVSFKPIGLWVIGANGRIDILSKNGVHLLVDKADYGQTAEWNLFFPQNRQSAHPFDSSFILKLVNQA